MIKVINVTDIQNGKQALLCLHFVYLRLSCIFLFRFLLLNDEYIILIAAEISPIRTVIVSHMDVFKNKFTYHLSDKTHGFGWRFSHSGGASSE